ncbi:maleylpyruvate isomerase family mycothiol-dependent enzyme [Georgenia subflava]|uniref:Maleylpyruvate isomerase family mycothiol-dependent enzyme n=1 Tax=Georgenia subflava TaxID=1622177 RepID=A0A6N7EFC9_9MICO|nr:maleylpyruvate isomerase family mycothiol-dependent enzyme [Georgenia subflava]MPV36091.1 maleylpyruvate isomerase family mycothiol-dependent enzyme [Georgenia subflava]
MRRSSRALWEVVHDERRRLVGHLADLSVAQWGTASLCPGWDVHDVLAHLVDTALTGRLSFVRDMIAARMDFDRANERGIARARRANPRETLAELRRAADLSRTPPASLDTRLVEAVVHGEDIRRPLGIGAAYPHWAVARALAYQLRTPVRFGGGRERAAGLMLVDTSTGTTHGTGPGVEAAAVDLLMAVSGRPVAPSRLTGAGVARLVPEDMPHPDPPDQTGRP